MVASTFFLRTRPPYNKARPGPVIISTRAALVSIQALSAEPLESAACCSSRSRRSLAELARVEGEDSGWPCKTVGKKESSRNAKQQIHDLGIMGHGPVLKLVAET